MPKTLRLFPILLLGMLWSAVPVFGDEDLSQDSSPALSAPSGTSDEAAPDAAALDDATLQKMIPKLTALAAASKDAASQDAAPGKKASQNTAPEESGPDIDSAVQMAQQEVRDPFAAFVEPEIPEDKPVPEGPAPQAGPPVEVNLQGIGFGSKDAYAIIGGEVFYIGDEKNGIKLLEVRRREVDIQANGGKLTVPLFPADELQKAKDRAQKKSSVSNASSDPKPEIPGSFSQGEQTPL